MFKKPKQRKDGGANFRKRSTGGIKNNNNRKKVKDDDNNEDNYDEQLNGEQSHRSQTGRIRRRTESSTSEDEDNDHRTDGNNSNDDEEAGTTSTTELLARLKKEQRSSNKKKRLNQFGNDGRGKDSGHGGVSQDLATAAADPSTMLSAQEMATRGAEYHPEAITRDTTSTKIGTNEPTTENAEGTGTTTKIYKGLQKVHNKFHAGPLKAPTFVRTTCRFDYQPDICKDYKETGFCGFGDTCIYLHDRGDTLTGWQLEQKYQEEKKQAELEKERQLNAFMDGMNQQPKEEGKERAAITATDDGIPFKCWICRKAFDQPIVTMCGHYFCTKCIMQRHRNEGNPSCPVCQADTGGVFNNPTKLHQKVRRVVGRDGTFEDYANAFTSG